MTIVYIVDGIDNSYPRVFSTPRKANSYVGELIAAGYTGLWIREEEVDAKDGDRCIKWWTGGLRICQNPLRIEVAGVRHNVGMGKEERPSLDTITSSPSYDNSVEIVMIDTRKREEAEKALRQWVHEHYPELDGFKFKQMKERFTGQVS